MSVTIQLRRDTAADWTTVNPVLFQGEIGVETDTLKLKIGDGSTAWSALAYWSGGAFANPMTAVGDLVAGGASGAATRVAAQTAASKKFLTETGNGTAGAAPVWSSIATGDVPTLNQSTTGNAGTATNLAGGAAVPAYLAPKVVALTDQATITVDASLGNDFRVTLGGNRTIANPTNPVDGQSIEFQLTQDGTGSRTVTWSSAYNFGTPGQPTLTTTVSKTDIVGFKYNTTKTQWLYVGSALGF